MNAKSIELTVNARYNENADCVCCKGNHRYTTFLTNDKNEVVDAGNLAHSEARK